MLVRRIKAGIASIFQVRGIIRAIAWLAPMPGKIPITTPMRVPIIINMRFWV
jgi:hypothetical protein